MAAATKSGEVIYIYNTKTKEGNCIVGPNGFPDYGRTDDGHILLGKVEGFMDIKIYGDHIYSIFSGKSAIEAMISDSIGGKYIYVFDKLGTPVIKYKLDKEIFSFCVDVSRNILYGLDPNSENFIVRYKGEIIMKHVKTLNTRKLQNTIKKGGCGECQTSCQSACKTSCTVGNQSCENNK